MPLPSMDQYMSAPGGLNDSIARLADSGCPTLPPPNAISPSWPAPRPSRLHRGQLDDRCVAASDLRATRGLSTAAVWMMGVVVVLAVASAVAQRIRLVVVDSASSGAGSLESVETMDRIVFGLAVGELAAIVLAGGFVMLWSYRIVRNAEEIADRRIGATRSWLGWVIPVAHLWVPFARLRRVAIVARRERSYVSWWQGGWIVLSLPSVGWVGATTAREELAGQAGVAVVGAVLTAIAAFLGVLAIRALDSGIAARTFPS